ncbi:MAG: 16S rRNA (guanine(527)-N(7))-methyltransferase RsmG [Geminicoccaceae bacterium]
MTDAPLSADDVAALLNVSRETMECLSRYLDLLKRWQPAINLVGPKSLDDPWRRHILDCAQLLRHLPDDAGSIIDLGSGAGLPGIVLSIVTRRPIELIESDQRKALFLKEVIRILELEATVQVKRIEALSPMTADIVTARALAPLARLLDISAPLRGPNTVCLFLKGRRAKDELTDAGKSWKMRSEIFPSLSDSAASILKLWDIRRAPVHCQ